LTYSKATIISQDPVKNHFNGQSLMTLTKVKWNNKSKILELFTILLQHLDAGNKMLLFIKLKLNL
ncbi:MAG: hypothetical protein AAF242_06220, partial [Bacteroidota bacterium]